MSSSWQPDPVGLWHFEEPDCGIPQHVTSTRTDTTGTARRWLRPGVAVAPETSGPADTDGPVRSGESETVTTALPAANADIQVNYVGSLSRMAAWGSGRARFSRRVEPT